MAKTLSKQISLGTDPMTGKRIRKWIHADSKTGLRQAEKDAIAEFARNGSPSQITYKVYEEKWFDAYKSNVQPSTRGQYKSFLKYSEPLHNKKIKDITKTDLQKIVSGLMDRPVACERYMGMMSSLWKCAVADGICSKDITIGIKRAKKTKTTRRPLNQEELEGVKKADFDEMEQFMVDLLLQFGLRPGEAFALNKQSFNKKDRSLTIDKAVSYNGNNPYIKSTKTGVTRVLPVPDSFWAKIPQTKTMYYFTENDGQLLTRSNRIKLQNSILNEINKAMGGTKKIRKTDITLYNFRHHKASLLYYLPGVSVKKKAQYMGHSEEMFLRIYSHMMEDKEDSEVLRDAVNL